MIRADAGPGKRIIRQRPDNDLSTSDNDLLITILLSESSQGL